MGGAKRIRALAYNKLDADRTLGEVAARCHASANSGTARVFEREETVSYRAGVVKPESLWLALPFHPAARRRLNKAVYRINAEYELWLMRGLGTMRAPKLVVSWKNAKPSLIHMLRANRIWMEAGEGGGTDVVANYQC